MKNKESSKYPVREHKSVYALLMTSAGMMGAYTYILRGGVFCNGQTANVVIMAGAFGRGAWLHGLYYLIPVSAYFLGAFVSELLLSPGRRAGALRWETCLILVEALTLLGIGFIPLTVPDQVVQVIINFIASMQFNTFRQAEGIPMANTFCTNHIRQVGANFARTIQNRDGNFFRRGLTHAEMVLCFFLGALVLTCFRAVLIEKAVWLALVPLAVVAARLVRADLADRQK